ncbi:MAG: hypothetical protein RR191_02515 [Cetobacterium sp.]|uniref:hypothetical protein n=1 Tax=unclassified Cetobacterium TaxID=2630983 RepID=UPI00163BA415|nr:hypothetical protein [Cetobacterium sp. 2A]MBC2856791.1 hypothetical protein [Cetobacterium sp. 2A]
MRDLWIEFGLFPKIFSVLNFYRIKKELIYSDEECEFSDYALEELEDELKTIYPLHCFITFEKLLSDLKNDNPGLEEKFIRENIDMNAYIEEKLLKAKNIEHAYFFDGEPIKIFRLK